MKKHWAKTRIEFTVGDWEELKKVAKSKGLRPSQYIHYALLETLEKGL
jgi:hypothetical protein